MFIFHVEIQFHSKYFYVQDIYLLWSAALLMIKTLFSFRPIISEKNELLIQFLSDLSLTADGFIGHYKFRPKKLPTTISPITTTTLPTITGEYGAFI